MKPTSRPWEQWKDHAIVMAGPLTENERGHASGGRGEVCRCNEDDFGEDSDEGKEIAQANAALIVQAVNNFDSLLAALEQIRDGAYDNAHDPKAAARIAAAAIAKAKGS